VPKDTLVRVRLRAGVGALLLPGDRNKDVNVSPGAHRTAVLDLADTSANTSASDSASGATSPAHSHGTITLDLRVGLGQIRVVR
jgi:hypothetical protein